MLSIRTQTSIYDVRDAAVQSALSASIECGWSCSFEHPRSGLPVLSLTPSGLQGLRRKIDIPSRIALYDAQQLAHHPELLWGYLMAARTGLVPVRTPTSVNEALVCSRLYDVSAYAPAALSSVAVPAVAGEAAVNAHSQAVRSPRVPVYRPASSAPQRSITPLKREAGSLPALSPRRTQSDAAVGRAIEEPHACVVCGDTEAQSAGMLWIQCDDCNRWSHVLCDPTVGCLSAYDDGRPNCRHYACVRCKQARPMRAVAATTARATRRRTEPAPFKFDAL